MANTTKYDRLYLNMKENLTVENSDCTLGEFMLMKAAEKKQEAALPVAIRPSASRSERTVALVCNYIEDKLTIKAEPEKDTVIRSFPLRTTAAAFLCAIVVSTFIVSISVIGAKLLTPKRATNIRTIDASQTEVVESTESAAAAME